MNTIGTDKQISVLFGADTRTEKLITINIGTGAGTPVDPTNLIGFPQVECLVFAPYTLFGYSNSTIDEFITINRTTGRGILFPVAGTSELIDIEGLAFIMADTSLFGNTAALTTDTEADNETSAPENYTLKQNYPNPFNPTTKIRFDIPDKFVGGEHVQLRIYNLLGELVRVLVDEQKFPGQYVVEWDGRDKHGKFVSSGIHIYQLVAGDLKETKRMLLLK